MCVSSSTRSAGSSWAGASRLTCAQRWSSTPSRWHDAAEERASRASRCTPTPAARAQVIEPKQRPQVTVHRRRAANRRRVIEHDHVVGRSPQPCHEPRDILDPNAVPDQATGPEELKPKPQTVRVGPHRVR